mmetsp:Transcript_150496/g.273896  ORF Transcript_150496/g.273896 Transcript_150496/m.273896 type:complete len:259 (+) Transcript_150496:122-898(+)
MGTTQACDSDCMEIAPRSKLQDESQYSTYRGSSSGSSPRPEAQSQLKVEFPTYNVEPLSETPSLAWKSNAARKVQPQRGRPDPAVLAHVTVDQHLDVLGKLEQAELRSEELSRETNELRRVLGGREAVLQQGVAERNSLQKGLSAAEIERNRLLSSLNPAREELSQANVTIAKLQRELTEAKLKQEALEAELRTSRDFGAKAVANCEQLQERCALTKRQLQAVCSLACSECRLRANDIDAVQEFFGEEARFKVPYKLR